MPSTSDMRISRSACTSAASMADKLSLSLMGMPCAGEDEQDIQGDAIRGIQGIQGVQLTLLAPPAGSSSRMNIGGETASFVFMIGTIFRLINSESVEKRLLRVSSL